MLLSSIFVMSLGCALLCLIPAYEVSVIRSWSLALTTVSLWSTLFVWWQFDSSGHVIQHLLVVSGSHLSLGLDTVGISLLMLITSLFPVCMSLLRTVPGFLTFLLLGILLLLALCVLDLLGFYVLFESTLVLLFLLIGRTPYGSMDAAYRSCCIRRWAP
jgi:NADH:ubiquinone oxidoreductase subunit 4 (subunit M)